MHSARITVYDKGRFKRYNNVLLTKCWWVRREDGTKIDTIDGNGMAALGAAAHEYLELVHILSPTMKLDST